MSQPCICGRAPRGFAYRRPADPYATTHHACSMQCIDFIIKYQGEPPVNLAPVEAEAIMAASEAVGTHLENLGKTDFATFTEEEWLDFLAATYSAIGSEVRARIASGEAPF